MQYGTERKIGEIRDFKGLVRYFRDELDWPLDLDEIEDLTFEYEAEELGLKADHAVKVKEIKQIRPVVDHQPWGIFWVEFENRALPVTVMRQILRSLVYKKRATAKAADRKAWHLKDLIFMSHLGEKGGRRINLSHFRETGEGEPTLQTFFWDEQETQFYWLDQNHLEHLRWPRDTDDIEGWRRQWASAFTAGYREPVRTAKDLSERLAALAARTRDAVLDVLRYESSIGPIHRLLESFQTVLLHGLDEAGFADMVAQTIAYGLFSARCTGQEVLGLAHLEAMVPNTNRFLKDLFAELARISGHRKGQINFDDLGLSEMVTLLRDKNIETVLEEFGRQAGGGKEDPVVHFYETFLSVYDKQQKVQRGVFYTPKPVVSFIVRSVHEILQQEFGLAEGLADTTTWGEMADRVAGLVIPKQAKASDPFVQILDPATGTGTFLEEVVEVVHATMIAKWKKQGKSAAALREAWNDYVSKHLLPRLRGFELMMAPYAVAHMKIGLKLRQTGYDFKSNERLRVYLTNTLEPPEKGTRKLGFLPDFLSHESMQADAVKEHKAITVVIGNPPYSGHSANKGDWIYDLMRSRLLDGADSYFNVDGAPIGERNPKWLNDDYVKFLRYGQSRIASSGAGVLGFITNHSYLDNPTFRGMRQSILATFDKALFLDLHGNSKKKEVPPDGDSNENVFDIQQGVAITLLRRSRTRAACSYGELWGTRAEKYDALQKGSLPGARQDITPRSPEYLFRPQDEDLRSEYSSFWKLTEAMPVTVLGFQSHRDHFAIDFDRRALRERILALRGRELKDGELRDSYSIPDNRDWHLSEARKAVRRDEDWEAALIRCSYRPFDERWCYLSTVAMDYPRRELLDHVANRVNLCLNAVRQTKMVSWQHALVSDSPTPAVFVELKDGSNVFPLYLYGAPVAVRLPDTITSPGAGRGLNFCPAFLEDLTRRLGLLGGQPRSSRAAIAGADIFHYIYAVFYSARFRSRYFQYLASDFPRVPLTTDLALFRCLGALGADLAALHLLGEDYPHASWNVKGADARSPFSNPRVAFHSDNDSDVAAGYPKYAKKAVFINPSAYFSPVDESTWEALVGGYQVCEKWLKDRRGRSINESDVLRYRQMIAALEGTKRTIISIDALIDSHGGWPLVGSTQEP
jgi:hypothetical protein